MLAKYVFEQRRVQLIAHDPSTSLPRQHRGGPRNGGRSSFDRFFQPWLNVGDGVPALHDGQFPGRRRGPDRFFWIWRLCPGSLVTSGKKQIFDGRLGRCPAGVRVIVDHAAIGGGDGHRGQRFEQPVLLFTGGARVGALLLVPSLPDRIASSIGIEKRGTVRRNV